ncbi:HD domain-containing protein [Actinokineospora auranticolor]|uniref:Putative nucleotidyltransferase with HDIG domain n=1 Tax=Actinokineospora auranticolor TaxID=155976 RepID=A0A2S6H0Y1_9PSEU|nr:HD domain-containing protein [Actinokineospora auranticolor]PPK71067.1 putative nucleotidyltransferase with HDIG domain [Actinokineospora auranticolor]
MYDEAGPTRAAELAAALLGSLGNRWRHTVAVAGRAAELAVTVSRAERSVLVSAAWLHDIGYAPDLVETGFHPIDGARYLTRAGWPDRIAALVAHHSGARFTAPFLGLGRQMATYPYEDSPVSDALTYADQTVDNRGTRVSLRDRFTEMLSRLGPDSANARAHHLREPDLLAAAHRVERRLTSCR